MNLYRLGAIPWDETQAIYHVLAQTGQEGLVICRPSSRCVCLGLHDDLAQEVDTAYCQANNIPLIRRDIGGGMVLLDRDQIFFQLVLRRDNPLLKGRREDSFAQFLAPAVKTLGDFSIQAAVKRPADIVVHGKKISGNGAGDIDGFAVYTGNLLIAFDRSTMANILNVPSQRFRELTRQSMERYLTTMEEELGYSPDHNLVEERLIVNFSAWLGNLQPAGYSTELQRAVTKTAGQLTSSEFLALPGKRTKVRQVKINEGTYIRLHFFPGCGAAGSACRHKSGQECSGYIILLIQNGMIRQFECQGLPCMEQGDAGLAPYLPGTIWSKPDIGAALDRWRQDSAGSRSKISQETLTEWLLYG